MRDIFMKTKTHVILVLKISVFIAFNIKEKMRKNENLIPKSH